MKKYSITIILLVSTCCLAQEPINRHLLKLNVFTPGLSYELGLTDYLSLNFDAQLSLYFHFAFNSSSYNNDESYILGFPSGLITLQYYFNRELREKRGRSLYKNSGMFISPAIYVQGPDIINTNKDYVDLRSAIGGGLMWGIQRTFSSNVNIVFGLGVGYAVADGPDALDGFVFLNKFTIGIVLFSQKRNRQIKLPIPEQDY